MNVNIYNHELTCKVEYSGRKTIQIRIIPPESIIIKAPYGYSHVELKGLIERKRDWIKKKLDFFEHYNIKDIDRNYISGEKFLLYGQEYVLSAIEDSCQKPSVAVVKDKLIVTVPSSDTELIKKVLEDFYRVKTKEIISKLSLKYGNLIGLKPNVIRIKKQNKRWGSCSSKRNLNFNLKLAMAPIEVIDYVVLHEFCHLRHMNHSKDFWNLVESNMPDYKSRKEWLKINGHRLKL